ncbi:MAG: MarR family transcriptional regulator [Treponema sp.]|nr:MarR family transcriptional regulator [Treponema sp.]
MKEETYDCLKISNQLCFPLYACSKEIIKRYKPYLDKLDLTYTQYITMMVLWENKSMNVKDLGKYLYLDSGTLTPVLKKLESKNYLTRTRSKEDERNVIINITAEGEQLKDEAVNVPLQMSKCVNLEREDAKLLYNLLHKILGTFTDLDDKQKEKDK